MNFLRLLFELFVIYMVYKLIFNFIIPVYRASRQMKNAMNKAQEQMRQQQNQYQQQHQQPRNTTVKKMQNDSEYIDYEEIR